MFSTPDARARLVHDLFVLPRVGGANFAMYTLWLPEQYPTECRASAFALQLQLAVSWGPASLSRGCRRFLLSHHRTPVALTSLAFLVGLLLLPFGKETKGELLPA